MKRLWLHRLIWGLMLLASAVLIGFVGGAASYLLFWSLVLMPVFSFVFATIVRAGVVIRMEVENSSVVRGERIPCTLRLINETFLPIPMVRIRMHEGKISFPEEERDLVCALKPGEERAFSFAPVAGHLGVAGIGAAHVWIPDWFFLTAAHYERIETMYILPRRQQLDRMQILPPERTERRRVERSYLGEKVPDGQWRLYQTGDDLRRVHWKLSARQQELVMKNLVPEPKNELILIPDSRADLPEGQHGWLAEDNIIEGTLAIADYFLRFGIALLVVPDLKRQVSLVERSGYQKLYKLMARGYFNGSQRPDEVLGLMETQNNDGRFIILTWEVDEKLIHSLSGAIAHGAEVTLIYIGNSAEAAALAAAERKLSFYQVTSRPDIAKVLEGTDRKGGAR
ncbi:MAG: DUF58 domain-containing protein [Firmicutes bacterium]|nr:DUF58 domain-containing protein [Bacillota bacterium]